MKARGTPCACWLSLGQVWLLTAASLLAQSTPVNPRELLEQKQYVAARERLRHEIADGHASLDNWLMLGIACAAAGADAEARDAYEEALKRKSDLPVALYNLAILSLRDERWEESAAYLRRLAAVKPRDTEARFALVHALAKSGRAAESYAEANEILRVESKPDVYVRTADILSSDLLVDESGQVLEKAHALWPAHPEITLRLARHAEVRGEHERVLELLAGAVAPEDANSHELLARSFFQLKRYNEAIESLQIAIKSDRAKELAQDYDMLILSHAALAQLNEVKRIAEESERRLGPRPSTVIALANLLQLQKRDPEAIVLLEQHRSQFSRSGEYLFTLGLAYHNAGDETRAVEILSGVTTLAPRLHQARYVLGMSLASMDNLAAAIEQLRQAVTAAPDHFLYHFELGVMLSKAMRKDEAEQSLLRSIQLNPEHVPAHYELARIYSDSGRTQKALSELQMCLALQPTDESSLYLLSRVYDKLGRTAEAVSARHSFQSLQELRLRQQREQHQLPQSGGTR